MKQENKILLAICGGIAAIKATQIIRNLQKHNFDCQVILTESGANFVSPLSLKIISKNEVIFPKTETSLNSKISHIELAQSAQFLLIAPATANIIAKLAYGIADDMLTTVFLATKAKCVIAPAMNNIMWEQEIVQKNIEILKKRGCIIIEPEEGYLACETIGTGRLANITTIINKLANLQQAPTAVDANNKKLSKIKALVTLGATIQPIDPFRFITNYSSGKMGFHLVQALQKYGAQVTAIVGKTNGIPVFTDITQIDVATTSQMAKAFFKQAPYHKLIIMCAAVSDYETTVNPQKIKDATLNLELKKSKDIIKAFSTKKPAGVITVGFAAESKMSLVTATKKAIEKNLDLLVLNQISGKHNTFGSDYSKAWLITKDKVEKLNLITKQELAEKIVDRVANIMGIDNQ